MNRKARKTEPAKLITVFIIDSYAKEPTTNVKQEIEMRLDYIKTSPGGVKAYGGVYSYVVQSGLEDILIDLVYLRVSQINGCAYCLDIHTRDLIKKNVAPEKLALVQVWREAGPMFSVREKTALAWAESVTRVADTHVPDEDFSAVAAVFSEKELADLTMAIGLMNAYNRLAISFRRVPDSVIAAKTKDCRPSGLELKN